MVENGFDPRSTCYTMLLMANRPRVQLDIPIPIRDRAKAIAYGRGMTLVGLVLHALSKEGDKELTKLIEKELATKQQPGRPHQK